MVLSIAHDTILLTQLFSLSNIVFLASSAVTHFFKQRDFFLLFYRVLLAYNVISIEFKYANESVAKFSVKFSTLSIKRGITYFKDFLIALLTKMNSFLIIIFLDMNCL